MSEFIPSFELLPVVTRGSKLMDLAAKNIPAMESHSEAETLEYLATYERVVGVWIDTERGNNVNVRALKGPPDDVEAVETAIPCRDEEDSRRWTILLNAPAPSSAIPNDLTIRLISKEGIKNGTDKK
ncbi:hypothetical protein [Afipia felis]|uniref:Uncharacterized protein n=2 Tax=Afipia felis TaxID=1035 RepID=A0A380WBZ8_AFIFE|nr:hypothetical protein [Afipia felis]EKS29386.1 hypothetical protein HMPREF9697_01914 [Afipia felis ATCC 53690]SUU78094.1 Uncharacterised protein [Afipia felis]SUU86159.1 Uncharacterised protein [Afipia felis]